MIISTQQPAITYNDYLIIIHTLHTGALQLVAIPDHGDIIKSTYYGYDQHDALSAFIMLIDQIAGAL